MPRFPVLIMCLVMGLCSLAGQTSAQSPKDVQNALLTLGYNVGAADGVLGTQSRNGIEAFQRAWGYPATRDLTPEQSIELLRMASLARNARAVGPIATDRRILPRDTWTVFEAGGGLYPVLSYANGMHYALARHGQVYESTNGYKAEFFKWNGQVQAWRWEQAMQTAQAEGDDYARALLLLDKKTPGQPDFQTEVLPALRVVVDRAKATPGQPAYTYRAIAAFDYRFQGQGACKDDSSAALALPILIDALALFEPHFTALPARGYIYKLAADCARGPQARALMEERLAMAEKMEPILAAVAARGLADFALAAGDRDAAKRAFARMHDVIMASVPGGYRDGANVGKVANVFTLMTMYDLGLKDRVDAAARLLAQGMITIPADQVFSSTAQQGNSLALLSALFHTRQVEPLRQIGLHLSGGANPWEAAQIAAGEALTGSTGGKAAEAASYFAPLIAQEGGLAAAARIATVAAEGWLRVGDLLKAEAMLDKALAWSSAAGTVQEVEQDIQTMRAQLNLSRAEAAGPGTALAMALDAFFDKACDGPVAGQPNPVAPDVDHAALAHDPEMRGALIRAGTLERMKTCGAQQMIGWTFGRLYCHLAVRQGQQSLATDMIARELVLTPYTLSSTQYQSCAFGIADSGQPDLLHPFRDRIGRWKESEVHFLAAVPDAEKPKAIADFLAGHVPAEVAGWDTSLLRFLKPANPQERLAEIDAYRNTYIVVNSGASMTPGEWESLTFGAYQEAIGWLGLGLPDVAEALIAMDDTLRLDALPGQGADWAQEVLADQRKLRLVEGHARVALARGDTARAKQILRPLVLHSLGRLGAQDGQALPASIEQFAFRGRSVFSLWLMTDPAAGEAGTYMMAQQALGLANSRASLSALDLRLTSRSPELARAYQEARRDLRRIQTLPVDERDNQALLAASNRLDELDSQVGADLRGAATGAFGVVIGLEALQERLGARSAGVLLVNTVGDDVLLSWVDSGGVQQKRLRGGLADLTGDIARFRSGITGSTRSKDLFEPALAKDLYDRLFGWIAGPMPMDISLVVDGPLVSLPFAALQTPDGAWLGAKHRLRMAPSAAWTVQERRTASPGTLPFLGVGAPDFRASGTRGVTLAPLPETEAELRFLAAAYGADPVRNVLLGQDASENRLGEMSASGELGQARVISFATHGLLAGETGDLGQAALALSRQQEDLSDGFLSSEEVFGLKLDADLVILAACNTGIPNSGDGLSELASAFLFAGSRSLMISHWSIDSDGTLEIMREFAFANLSGQQDVAESLRLAIEKLATSDGAFAHPSVWAALFILG